MLGRWNWRGDRAVVNHEKLESESRELTIGMEIVAIIVSSWIFVSLLFSQSGYCKDILTQCHQEGSYPETSQYRHQLLC